MNKTIVAASFFIVSALIGAAAVYVLMGPAWQSQIVEPGPRPASPTQDTAATEQTEAADPNPPSFVVSDHRVAVRFPNRYEFERLTRGEARFWDPGSKTRVGFHVSRLTEAAGFEDRLADLIRMLTFRGTLGEPVYLSQTHVRLTYIEMFRVYTELEVFVGEDCWGKPLLVQAFYQYDRTTSDENYWHDQDHSDFPQFEFAYRCPGQE